MLTCSYISVSYSCFGSQMSQLFLYDSLAFLLIHNEYKVNQPVDRSMFQKSSSQMTQPFTEYLPLSTCINSVEACLAAYREIGRHLNRFKSSSAVPPSSDSYFKYTYSCMALNRNMDESLAFSD